MKCILESKSSALVNITINIKMNLEYYGALFFLLLDKTILTEFNKFVKKIIEVL